jgi:hypothetical protein
LRVSDRRSARASGDQLERAAKLAEVKMPKVDLEATAESAASTRRTSTTRRQRARTAKATSTSVRCGALAVNCRRPEPFVECRKQSTTGRQDPLANDIVGKVASSRPKGDRAVHEVGIVGFHLLRVQEVGQRISYFYARNVVRSVEHTDQLAKNHVRNEDFFTLCQRAGR